MASIGHLAAGLAAGRWYAGDGDERLRASLVFGGLAMLPDADAAAFWLGVPYGAAWGHRGASHSLMLALVAGLAAASVCGLRSRARWQTALAAMAAAASHGLLDTMTNGGLGAALLWPISDERCFAPWRPLPVAPIGRRLLSERGLRVLAVEFVAFLPLFVYALRPARCPPRSRVGAALRAE